jgi:hypothetical protein
MKFKILMLITFISAAHLKCMEKEQGPIAINALLNSKKRKLRRKQARKDFYYKKALIGLIQYRLYNQPYQSTHVPPEIWFPLSSEEFFDLEDSNALVYCFYSSFAPWELRTMQYPLPWKAVQADGR